MADDLDIRGHASMVERFRTGALADGGEAVAEARGLLWAYSSPFPLLLNGAVRMEAADPHALIESARGFFAERHRGFTMVVRPGDEDADLEAAMGEAGLHLLLPRYPIMVRRERFADPAQPGAELRRVVDEAGARDYAAVLEGSYADIGFPPGALGGMRPSGFLEDDVTAFVAHSGGEPVAAAMVHMALGIAGIEWVGTIPAARRRGLGEACTAAAVNAGFDRGADVAWLEASPMGEPVYRRMGFENHSEYRLWVAQPPG